MKNGGKNRFWNENFEIVVDNLTEEMKASYLDEDWLVNDKIGEATLSIRSLCDVSGTKKWIPIYYKGAAAGEILVFGKYTPPIDSRS